MSGIFDWLFGDSNRDAERNTPPRTLDQNSRVVRDRQVVASKLPPSTVEKTLDGATHWVYSFNCQLGTKYTLTVYFDGVEYQVKVLEPALKAKYSVHDTHLFSDGRICLNPPGNGAATLEDAYAKSVVWANGFSIYQQLGKFPFSKNNG